MLVGTLPACGPGPGSPATLTVLAASSLTAAFEVVARRFEADHPGTRVVLSFGSSSALARQVVAGAPADVLATADDESMEPAVRAAAVAAPLTLARNRMAVLVPAGNPGRVTALADLARPGLAVVLCAPEVPCGRLARAVLDRAGLRVEARSLEPSVRAVVTRVTSGEADAGIVYATDAAAAGPSRSVAIPEAVNAATAYRIAVAAGTPRPGLARAFVALALSPAGQEALAGLGFDRP